MEIQHSFVVLNGQKIGYYHAGQESGAAGKKTVVLLHGGGVDSALLSWRKAIEPLAEEYSVYAPDWPGYGQSEWQHGTYSVQSLVDVLDEFLKALKIENPTLIGLSMGGAAALGFALAFPDRVNRLVLVDSYGLQSKVPFYRLAYWFVQVPALTRWTYAWLRKSKPLTRTSIKSIFGDPARVSPEIVDEVFDVIQNPEMGASFYQFQVDEVQKSRLKTCYMDQLGRVKARTLIIHGEKDYLVPLADARMAAEKIDGAKLEIIPGCGHWPPREQPEIFNRLVMEFLGQ